MPIEYSVRDNGYRQMTGSKRGELRENVSGDIEA